MTTDKKKNFMAGKLWIIILVVMIASYNIYNGVNKRSEWTKESTNDLVESCLRNPSNMTEEYPELTKEYCKCSVGNIQTEYTYNEYVKISKQSPEVQNEKLIPSFEKCFTEYQEKINNLN